MVVSLFTGTSITWSMNLFHVGYFSNLLHLLNHCHLVLHTNERVDNLVQELLHDAHTLSSRRPVAYAQQSDSRQSWWSSYSSSFWCHGWQDWHSSHFFNGTLSTRDGNLHVRDGGCTQYTAPYALLHATFFLNTPFHGSRLHRIQTFKCVALKLCRGHLHAMFSSLLIFAQRPAFFSRVFFFQGVFFVLHGVFFFQGVFFSRVFFPGFFSRMFFCRFFFPRGFSFQGVFFFLRVFFKDQMKNGTQKLK